MSARIEFRCPHGFLRSVVRCPHGCATLPGQALTVEGKVRQRPPTRQRRERAERRPRWSDVGDGHIIVVLHASESAAAAARELGASPSNLYVYARSRPAVWPAYQDAKERGLRSRGTRGRACGFRT